MDMSHVQMVPKAVCTGALHCVVELESQYTRVSVTAICANARKLGPYCVIIIVVCI